MFTSITRPLLAALALSACHTLACAADSASLEFATGNKTQMLRTGLQWQAPQRWFESNGTHLGWYWDATFAYWRGNRYQNLAGNQQNLYDLGITPVFRLQSDSKKGWYGEAAVGLHMLSELYDNNHRSFSTRMQFGDHIGLGYTCENGWDVALKIQHYSNGGIKHPNPGVNYAVVKAAYAF